MSEIDRLYEAYQAAPGPATLAPVVTAAAPMVRYSLSSVNGMNNPVLKSRAKMFVADAVKSFDPTKGASLRTHIGNNLMQIRRAAREVSTPIRVPERMQLDAAHLNRKELEFTDKFGRAPDLPELADFSNLGLQRITTIRKMSRSMPSEAAIGDAGSSVAEPDYVSEATGYVYNDSDYIDRKILELRGGYGGADPLPAHEVAARLGLTAPQLSRRAAKLSLRVSETTKLLETA